ncbi:MAG: hypothetical protein AAFQ82_06650 [Myxococcota bacterium]
MKTYAFGATRLTIEASGPAQRELERRLAGFTTEPDSAAAHVEIRPTPPEPSGDGLLLEESSFSVEYSPERASIWYQEPTPNASETPAHVGVLHVLSLAAIDSGQLLVHASAVREGRNAWVFVGPSGAGKSTLASWYPPSDVLNDDFVLLEPGSELSVHSQPFFGKTMADRLGTALSARVRSVFTLHHNTLALRVLAPQERFIALMDAVALPKQAGTHRARALELAEQCIASSWSELSFSLEPERTRAFLKTLP